MKVRKEVGDAMNMIQGNLGLFRQRLQLITRQVTVLILNGSEIVENQKITPSLDRLPLHSGVRFLL